jgi:trehalose 6-phosphate synthase
MRRLGYAGGIGFFLHTPFPDVDVAYALLDEDGQARLCDWIAGILGADLVGFQCPADVARFRAAVTSLKLAAADGEALRVDSRRVVVGAFPVGIDVDDVAEVAQTAELPALAATACSAGLTLVVGLERADYTKGIPERFAALAALARTGRRFAYLGVASPTRGGVESYSALGEAIRRGAEAARAAIDKAGGSFTYVEQALTWPEVVALLREADVVCTSSLADGMNLVPLQAVAAQSIRPAAKRGVVLTGRDAGVASTYAGREDDGLVPIDPLDTPSFAAALGQALDGRPGRISDRLVADVRKRDARRWGSTFLETLKEAAC